MPITTVANNIEHDVFAKFLAILRGDARRKNNGFGVVAIDVKNRRFDHKGDVRTILTRTIFIRRSCEANLVVDNDMQCAAGAVADELRHLEGFHDHALPRKRTVTMQNNGHDLFGIMGLICARRHLLFRAGLTDHDRRDDFEM